MGNSQNEDSINTNTVLEFEQHRLFGKRSIAVKLWGREGRNNKQ
jgi:hypothetical protein